MSALMQSSITAFAITCFKFCFNNFYIAYSVFVGLILKSIILLSRYRI